MGESLPNHHEDHITGQGNSSQQHYHLVHKFCHLPQAINQISKDSSGKRMGKIGENFGVEPDESQKEEKGDR